MSKLIDKKLVKIIIDPYMNRRISLTTEPIWFFYTKHRASSRSWEGLLFFLGRVPSLFKEKSPLYHWRDFPSYNYLMLINDSGAWYWHSNDMVVGYNLQAKFQHWMFWLASGRSLCLTRWKVFFLTKIVLIISVFLLNVLQFDFFP